MSYVFCASIESGFSDLHASCMSSACSYIVIYEIKSFLLMHILLSRDLPRAFSFVREQPRGDYGR